MIAYGKQKKEFLKLNTINNKAQAQVKESVLYIIRR
jgi:hypothetical protein